VVSGKRGTMLEAKTLESILAWRCLHSLKVIRLSPGPVVLATGFVETKAGWIVGARHDVIEFCRSDPAFPVAEHPGSYEVGHNLRGFVRQ
jgi:hypothetical protein